MTNDHRFWTALNGYKNIYRLLHSYAVNPINIGNPSEFTIKAFAEVVNKLIGVAKKGLVVPIGLLWLNKKRQLNSATSEQRIIGAILILAIVVVILTVLQRLPANAFVARSHTNMPINQSAQSLRGSYYANHKLTGEPATTQFDGPLDFRWEQGGSPVAGLSAPFSVRWEGFIQPRFSETYTIFTTSDDGVRLWVDEQLRIDNWTIHAATEDRVEIALVAGRFYPITLEFFDRGYSGILRLEWMSRSLSRQVIPANELFYLHRSTSAGQPDQSENLILRSTPIDLEAPEIINPMRGFYRWRNNEVVPSPDPLPQHAFEAYDRYEWRDLERARDQYDFSILDKAIAKSAAEGRKHSFRIRSLISSDGSQVPDYLMALMERGWWHDYDQDGTKDTYVPDWNDPDFLARVNSLLQALGARYNNDPRVGLIDIGIFGNWGEWHMDNFPYPSPSGARSIFSKNRQRLVDMHLAAFPNKRLLMLSDDEATLLYALQASPTIGWRRDSLGIDHFDKVSSDPETWELLKDRWKTAPVVTEFISPSRQESPKSYITAREQVQRYHVSMIGNGNIHSWNKLDAIARSALVHMAKTSGYRFLPAEVVVPRTLYVGSTFTITSSWSNLGVAPIYEPWSVIFQLRKQVDNSVVWEHRSSLDLQTVLPTSSGNNNSSVFTDGGILPFYMQHDTVQLPPSMETGKYNLTLIVRDPAGYWEALGLAIEGRQKDGSYILGTITIDH